MIKKELSDCGVNDGSIDSLFCYIDKISIPLVGIGDLSSCITLFKFCTLISSIKLEKGVANFAKILNQLGKEGIIFKFAEILNQLGEEGPVKFAKFLSKLNGPSLANFEKILNNFSGIYKFLKFFNKLKKEGIDSFVTFFSNFDMSDLIITKFFDVLNDVGCANFAEFFSKHNKSTDFDKNIFANFAAILNKAEENDLENLKKYLNSKDFDLSSFVDKINNLIKNKKEEREEEKEVYDDLYMNICS